MYTVQIQLDNFQVHTCTLYKPPSCWIISMYINVHCTKYTYKPPSRILFMYIQVHCTRYMYKPPSWIIFMYIHVHCTVFMYKPPSWMIFMFINVHCEKYMYHWKLRFISSTGPTLYLLEQAVQYKYRQFKAKRDGTPNKQSPST